MGHPYYGPAFDKLPESIRDRVQSAAMIAQNETRALGVNLINQADFFGEKAAEKMQERFGNAREVFIYVFGQLQKAYFREGDQVFSLSFSGISCSDNLEGVEKALGLDVVKRPFYNQDEAEIRIGDEPLKRLARHNYARSLFGPYMVRS